MPRTYVLLDANVTAAYYLAEIAQAFIHAGFWRDEPIH
jgi:hypothetical protein